MASPPSPPAQGATGTREQLLDAAEELFGELGYAATSLRQLTKAAGTNLAAVNYHFGSKEDLAKAVLARRIAPINAERLRRLEALRAEGKTLEAVVRAFVEPPFRIDDASRDTASSSKLCRVFGRINLEQPPFLREFLSSQFRDIGQRFVAEFVAVVPGLSLAQAWWGLHFLVGAIAHTLQNAGALQHLSDGQCAAHDIDRMIDELVAFAVGGLRQQASATAPQESSS